MSWDVAGLQVRVLVIIGRGEAQIQAVTQVTQKRDQAVRSAFYMPARERRIAARGFNRWVVPAAAVSTHLCIGMAYGFSVFWLPLSRALGVTQAITCSDFTFSAALVAADCDWRVTDLESIDTLFFLFMGLSAALGGAWAERSAPRTAAIVAAICWPGGIAIAALGVIVHQLWIVWAGAGVIGGIGLGLGFVAAIATLLQWFPDRRGMATGLALMAFGAGTLIAPPFANALMMFFRTPSSVGVWETWLALAAFCVTGMMAAAFAYRLPPPGWQAPGDARAPRRQPEVRNAHTALPFWLMWVVLYLCVSAGIGLLGIAPPMLQDIFGAGAVVAARFAALLLLVNAAGRLAWPWLSDRIGRKPTYLTMLILGIALQALAPTAVRQGQIAFVLAMCLIASISGGAFATIPAYVADTFGTPFAGAIYGRLLTSWSAAGIATPYLMRYIRDKQRLIGVPWPLAYNITIYLLAAMLLLALIGIALLRPVASADSAAAP